MMCGALQGMYICSETGRLWFAGPEEAGGLAPHGVRLLL